MSATFHLIELSRVVEKRGQATFLTPLPAGLAS
jgi:hypothetical protein